MAEYPVSEEDLAQLAEMVELMPNTDTKEEFFAFVDENREQCRIFFMFLFRMLKKIKIYLNEEPLAPLFHPNLYVTHGNCYSIASAFAVAFAELGVEPTADDQRELFGRVLFQN
jgi:hypothetical protein